MRLDSFFSGALCALSGGRLPEALFMVFLLDSKGAKACKSCRSRQELSNEYLLAKIGFDTAENEPSNFDNFTSPPGLNFHQAVVSDAQTDTQPAAPIPGEN